MLLGVDRDGLTRQSLAAAWRGYARANHPDACPGDVRATSRFVAGRRAFEALHSALGAPPVHRFVPATRIIRGPAAAAASPYQMAPVGSREWRA